MKTACVNNVVKRSCQTIPSHLPYWIGLLFSTIQPSHLIKTHLPDMSGNPTSTVIFPRSHKAAAPLLSRQMGISSLTCSVRDREAGQQDHLRRFAQTDGKIARY